MGCEFLQKTIICPNKYSPQLFENLWDKKRLSDFLSVPIRTIDDWVYKRQIPFVRVGRHVRFIPSDVQKWLAERNNVYGHSEN